MMKKEEAGGGGRGERRKKFPFGVGSALAGEGASPRGGGAGCRGCSGRSPGAAQEGGGSRRRSWRGEAKRRPRRQGRCCSSFGSLGKFPLPWGGGKGRSRHRRWRRGTCRGRAEGNAKGGVLGWSGGVEAPRTRGESWQMSQAREPLPPGPEGPAPAAPTECSLLLSLPRVWHPNELISGKPTYTEDQLCRKELLEPCFCQKDQCL
ncbi:myoD family inhibitor domain-containing protein isoform X2 [Dermochelys coriacea]|uniref:myoD family inhibitor domain-containing protein isoform X2 n=1 Tax=Dermochelys coriacea TaxID=27794 RepID=UPI001CA7D5B5|nr:myoD family inhibitor domain-containing protein isoform X2 [Dermochelys coriacea]